MALVGAAVPSTSRAVPGYTEISTLDLVLSILPKRYLRLSYLPTCPTVSQAGYAEWDFVLNKKGLLASFVLTMGGMNKTALN